MEASNLRPQIFNGKNTTIMADVCDQENGRVVPVFKVSKRTPCLSVFVVMLCLLLISGFAVYYSAKEKKTSMKYSVENLGLPNEGVKTASRYRYKRDVLEDYDEAESDGKGENVDDPSEELTGEEEKLPRMDMHFIVTISGGEISSDGYPERYRRNEEQRWILISEDGNKNITLDIVDLHIEESTNCSYDYLEIVTVKSGDEEEESLLGHYCGLHQNIVINTGAPMVKLRFKSDYNYEEKGFFLKYRLQTPEGCKEFVNASEGRGYLSSPNFPDNYPDSVDCWTVISSPKGSTLSILLKTVELEKDEECSYDFVEFYDGSTKDAESLGRFCSYEHEGKTLTSTNNQILVHFYSDELLNYGGYQIQYSTDGLPSTEIMDSELGGCNLLKEAKSGIITSPNYPELYPANITCIVRIQAEPNEAVTLDFEELFTEADENCTFDRIEVYDGFGSNKTHLGTFCTGNQPDDILKTATNQLLLVFTTDNTAEYTGFKAIYKIHLEDDESDIAMDQEHRKFVETLKDAIVKEGDNHVLRCKPVEQNHEVLWKKDGRDLWSMSRMRSLERIDANTVWIKRMSAELEGNYTCLIPSNQGWVRSTARILMDRTPQKICPFDVLIDVQDNVQQVTENGHLVMSCKVTGTKPISAFKYEWMFNGNFIRPEHYQEENLITIHNYILGIRKISLSDAGIYTCVVTELQTNCSTSGSKVISVIPRADLGKVCGKPRIGQPGSKGANAKDRGKIVGGREVERGAYPWQAMIWESKMGPFCSGTLLNERWVLTAAHCFARYNVDQKKVRIRFGKHDRTRNERTEVSAGIQELFVHKDYDLPTFDNDIALILLDTHVNFTDFILPACLGDHEYMEEKFFARHNEPQFGMVSGWGRIYESGPLPRYLLEVKLPIVDDHICRESTDEVVTKNMFCAGNSQNVFEDSCKGDSGGPFVIKRNGKWYVVGIVSWGEGCARRGKYGFYTKVSNYDSWIKGLIQKS